MSRLSEEDQKYLRRSASDRSDIAPEVRARIDRDFRAAYQRAEEIRLGLRNPLA